MKKVMLLAKSFVVLSLLFCSIGVFAEIPKTINVQGKITNDSGAPITNTNATVELLVSENNFTSGTPYTFTSNGSTPVDSEGLYNVDININNPNVDFSKQYYFKVKVTVAGNTIESEKKPFASNPYAFYASEATSAGSITVPGDEDGLVWATKKEGNKFIQEWIKPTTLEISPANNEKIGGIKLGEKTGLSNDISEDGILRVLPATKETIGGVIVATNYGLDIGEDGTLNISPASTGGFGVVKLGTKKGLGLESNALVVSVDGTTIGIDTQNGQLKVVDNVFQPKLTVGNGINIDNSNKITAKLEDKKGLSSGADGLSVSVDGTTIGINTTGQLKVADNVFQPKLTVGNGINIDNSNKITAKLEDKKGLSSGTDGLSVSVDGTTIGINTTGQLKVADNLFQPKLTVGNGINIDNSNKITTKVESNKGLSLGTDGLSVSVDGTTIGINTTGQLNVKELPSSGGDRNKVWGFKNATTQDWVSISEIGSFQAKDGLRLANGELKVLPGAGLEIDTVSNEIYVSTGTGLTIDSVTNTINVTAATADNIGGFKLTPATSHDSGLTMGNDAILKVNVGTGKGLEIDNDNELKVTSIGASLTAESPSTDREYYVWAYDTITHTQKWIRTKYVSSWVSVAAGTIYYYSGADLAEIYQSTEKLVPGDVVSIDPAKDNAIVKTKVAEDTMVAGVISTEPGVLMNQDEKGYKLALVGKVPTKVCNEGGAIKRGDLLVSASIPGYAKKAGDNPKVGTVIGKALENSDSQKGTILVLVNLQ